MEANRATSRSKHVQVKRGNVTVKIYTGKNRVAGKVYPQFTLVYYDGSQRKKVRFAELAAAKREAELVAVKLASGEHEVLRLTSADRALYMQAVAHLGPLGTPLNVAVLEYVSAVKCLPEGTTLKQAVDLIRQRNPASLGKRTMRQVADEMLAAKRAAYLSNAYLSDLEVRLNRMCIAFQMNITDVSGMMLQGWLDEMEGSGRTKQNYLRVVTALFRFAIRRKYLPKDAIEEVDAVQRAKKDNGEIEIFTCAEMNEILITARPEMIPCLAIAGFSGLRTAEIQRLDWSEINVAERHIEIKASKAKTAARRLAPITDNLAAWLDPYVKPAGKVTEFESSWKQISRLVEEINRERKEHGNAAKFVWKHNGLRHSFCSYRLGSIKNAAQVALEAGNSPQMIFGHYRQLVTESEAAKWFAIAPHTSANAVTVIQPSVA
ncbi:MAG TPA: site-specific integrase [Candidatus Baltobacteraceae bacterium]|jgi:integrase|nr:site-specific integrase [Candidatus Baltobacteraceae bacterium]